eukprot:s6_g37.t1
MLHTFLLGLWQVARLLLLVQLLGTSVLLLDDSDSYGILRLARQSPDLFQHLWWCSAGLVIGCFLSMGMLQENSELRRHLDPMIPVMGGAMTWIFGRMLQFSEELAQSKQRWELQQKNTEPLLQAKREAQKSREDAESFRKEAEALRKQVEAIQKQAANQASEYMRLDSENRLFALGVVESQ